MTKGPGRLDRSTTSADLEMMAAVYEGLAMFAEPLGVTVTFHPHIIRISTTWSIVPMNGNAL